MRRTRRSLAKTRAVLAALWLVAELAGADPPGIIGGDYLYDSWQRQDGLPQISVTAIVQDLRGYLWIGTGEGLARFDGESFTVLDRRNTPQLPSNDVRALLADRDGSLWIATRRGLARRTRDRLVAYTVADGLIHDDVRCLFQSGDGSLWIGTAGGLGRRDNTTGAFEAFGAEHGLRQLAVSAITADRSGVLWIGTDGGLGRFESGRFSTVYSTDNGLVDNHVRALYEDRRGDLWIGTDGGLHRLREGSLDTFTVDDGLAHPVVSAFGEDEEGWLWIGTDGGLSRLDAGGLRAYGLQTLPGNSGNRVRALWRDHEGSLWVGTGLMGLLRLRRTQLTVLGSPEGLIDEPGVDDLPGSRRRGLDRHQQRPFPAR